MTRLILWWMAPERPIWQAILVMSLPVSMFATFVYVDHILH